MNYQLVFRECIIYFSRVIINLSIRRSDQFRTGLSTDLAIKQSLMRTVKSRWRLTRGWGMTESVRLLWTQMCWSSWSSKICGRQPLKNLKRCSLLKQSISLQFFLRLSSTQFITELSRSKHTTSEQHAELGNSRKRNVFLILWRFFSGY